MKKTILALLLLVATSAQAAPAVSVATPVQKPEDERVMALLGNATEAMKDKVAVVLNDQQAKMNPACPRLSSFKSEDITVFALPAFDLDGHPKAGEWQIRYTVKACGKPLTRTVLFTAKEAPAASPKDEPTGQTTVKTLMPGLTLADPTLGADVWKSLQGVALRAQPECKQPPILQDAQILERPRTPKSTWRELWQAELCGATLVEVITFYPTPEGTMFRMTLPTKPMQPIQLHQTRAVSTTH